MADYIKREDAIAYPLSWDHYDKKNGNRHFIAGVESYREYIEVIPPADVVEVVRCRDCRYWEYDVIFPDGWCRGKRRGNPEWYCADAERRTDETD